MCGSVDERAMRPRRSGFGLTASTPQRWCHQHCANRDASVHVHEGIRRSGLGCCSARRRARSLFVPCLACERVPERQIEGEPSLLHSTSASPPLVAPLRRLFAQRCAQDRRFALSAGMPFVGHLRSGHSADGGSAGRVVHRLPPRHAPAVDRPSDMGSFAPRTAAVDSRCLAPSVWRRRIRCARDRTGPLAQPYRHLRGLVRTRRTLHAAGEPTGTRTPKATPSNKVRCRKANRYQENSPVTEPGTVQ